MTSVFRFRLEAVRKLRQETRDRQRRAAAAASAKLNEATETKDRIAAALKENVKQLRAEKAVGAINIPVLRAGYLHQGSLVRKSEEADVSLQEIRQEFEAQRKLLGEANARLKTIEKLRERKWRRHRAQIHRAEQAIGDEVALRVYVTQRNDAVEPAEAVNSDR